MALLSEQADVIDVAQKIFDEADLCADLEILPVRRSEMMTMSGVLDGELMRTSFWAEQHQDQVVMVPTPFYVDHMVVISLDSRDLDIATLSDLKPLNVVISGGHRWAEAQMAALGIVPMETNLPSRFLELVRIGRVDVGLVEQSVLSRLGNLEGLRISPVTPLAYHIVLRREHAPLVPALDASLKRFRASNLLK